MSDVDDLLDDNPLLQLSRDAQQGLVEWVQAGQPESIDDAEGNQFSLSDLTKLGFTRREAIAIFGIMAGSTLTGYQAIQQYVGTAQAADTGVAVLGESGNPADVHLDQILDGNGTLCGDLDTDGSFDWQGSDFTNLGSVNTETLDITGSPNLNYPSALNLDHDSLGALKDGYPVAIGADAAYVIDPDNFADDSAALNWLNDQIIAQSRQVGTIFIPPSRPGNGFWSFPSTVTFGSSTTQSVVNVIHVAGGVADGSAILTTSIDDGSPMFEFVGPTGPTMREPFVELYAHGGNNNNQMVKFKHVNGFRLRGRLTGTAGTVVQVDGQCFGFDIDNVRISPSNGGVGVKFTDEDNVDQPGNGSIGTGAIFDGTADRQVYSTVACPSLNIQGYYDSASGPAVIDLSTVNSAKVSPSRVRGGNNLTHGILADSGSVMVGAIGEFAQLDDAIHANDSGNMTELKVSNQITYSGVNNAIVLANDVGVKAVLPDPDSIANSVTYPGGGTTNTYTMDVTQQ